MIPLDDLEEERHVLNNILGTVCIELENLESIQQRVFYLLS